ncbi:hypothetical protein TRVL_09170 [Trypanosoma vivax]|nr:hypothetical protein TRVL_09170 [Trypanosoma vivax]
MRGESCYECVGATGGLIAVIASCRRTESREERDAGVREAGRGVGAVVREEHARGNSQRAKRCVGYRVLLLSGPLAPASPCCWDFTMQDMAGIFFSSVASGVTVVAVQHWKK